MERRLLLNWWNEIWKFFASVRLTIVLLISLAATSIIGTLIPQNEDPVRYYQAFGEFLFRIFSVLDLFDMYHSWWFQLLLVLLTSNIIVCSIDRLQTTGKIIFSKEPSFRLSKFRSLSEKEEFSASGTPHALAARYEPYIAKRFGYCRTEETAEGLCIFAEKWRWTRLGVYTVHLSIVLLLIGGLIGSLFGFEGFVNIPEGETIQRIRLRNTGGSHQLDFGIRCDDFNVSFYENGSPKEYRSKLRIVEQGQTVLQKEIIVNDPLRYKGINIFQSSYGALEPEKVTLGFKSNITEMIYHSKVTLGQQVDIPESLGKFVIRKYSPAAEYRGHQIGAAFTGIFTPPGGKSTEVLLPLRFPSFDKMRKGDFIVSVEDYESRYYTGLQVTRDPGVGIVYAGFIVMIIGCAVTFFMSHQRLCIDVIGRGSKSRVTVTGSANKNRVGMQMKLSRMAQKLALLN